MPIFVLGTASGTLSEMIRHLREELSRVLAEDYIRTARAKGAPVWRHAFKEGFLIPVTGIMSAKIPFLLGGAVIVEQVFNWPGMGRMAWQAAQDRDFPVIMGVALARRGVRAPGQPAAPRRVHRGQSARFAGVGAMAPLRPGCRAPEVLRLALQRAERA